MHFPAPSPGLTSAGSARFSSESDQLPAIKFDTLALQECRISSKPAKRTINQVPYQATLVGPGGLYHYQMRELCHTI